MDTIYVLEYIGTPMGAFWSWGSAHAMIMTMDKRDYGEVKTALDKDARAKRLAHYTIHEVPLEDIAVFIRQSMRNAGESDPNPVVIPSTHDAFFWMVSEVGEAAGAYIGALDSWKRNNPEKHEFDDYGKEIGQVILMAFLAATVSPIEIIRRQLAKWGWIDMEPKDVDNDPYGMLYDIMCRRHKQP